MSAWFPQILPHGVERLRQRVPSAVGVAHSPQTGKGLVARDHPLLRRGEQREAFGVGSGSGG